MMTARRGVRGGWMVRLGGMCAMAVTASRKGRGLRGDERIEAGWELAGVSVWR